MDTNQLLVVIEKGFADARRELDERFSNLRGELDDRFARVDQRFDAVDQRFDAVDQRFDAVNQHFKAVEDQLAKTHELAHTTRILVEDMGDKMRVEYDAPETLGKRVSALEVRVTKLEKRRK